MVELVALGETMGMVTPTPGGRLGSAKAYQLHAGGAESNVAMYAAGLGHSTAWASRLGTDSLGDFVLREIASAGVDVRGVERDAAKPTGVYFKDPTEVGTRVWYYRQHSAASQMGREMVRPLLASRAQVLHLSGITPVLSESCHDLVSHLVRDRPLGDTVVSFDVNLRPALGEPHEVADSMLTLANASDIVFVGLDEASTLWGCSVPDDVRRVVPLPKHLIVKDGANEAVWFGTSGREAVPAPSVEVVELVGAGDAFAAGWLSGCLRELDPRDRLRLGHRVAGACLRATSDYIELPSPDTIREELRIPEADWTRGSRIVAR